MYLSYYGFNGYLIADKIREFKKETILRYGSIRLNQDPDFIKCIKNDLSRFLKGLVASGMAPNEILKDVTYSNELRTIYWDKSNLKRRFFMSISFEDI